MDITGCVTSALKWLDEDSKAKLYVRGALETSKAAETAPRVV